MKLSARERDFIALAGVKADRSLAELSKELGCHQHITRYVLQSLLTKKAIRKAWIIDTFKLGWQRYNMFFSLGLEKPKVKEKILAQLVKLDRTAYLAEVGGDFDFEISIYGHHVGDALSFFHEMASVEDVTIANKSVTTRHFMALFPRKYLSTSKRMTGSYLDLSASPKLETIDELDTKILSLMTEEPFISSREIARRISHAASSIDLRINRLKDRGIIRGAVYSTNPNIYGAQAFMLLVYAKGFDPKLRSELFNFAKDHPHCTYFSECFGSWDFEIGLEVEQYSQLVLVKEQLSEKVGALLNSIKVLARFASRKYVSFPH